MCHGYQWSPVEPVGQLPELSGGKDPHPFPAEPSGIRALFIVRWVLAVAVRRVEHNRVLPELGCYEERYRLTGRAALGLAASLLSIGLGFLWHTPVMTRFIGVAARVAAL